MTRDPRLPPEDETIEEVRLRARIRQELALQARMDASPIAQLEVSLVDGTILRSNHRAEVLFGYERSGLVGRPIEVLLPIDLVGNHTKHRAYFAAHPVTLPMDGKPLRARRRGGDEINVEVAIRPIDSANAVMAWIRRVKV